jgi:hypothetical protein
MKPVNVITLVVLCTAFFVTVNAAPVLPSGYESEMLSDSSIQAGSELGQTFINFASSPLSAASKKADQLQNDELQQSLFNGILSSLGKWLGNEGGEIQSDDETMQALFGTPSTKSNEVHVQSSSNKVLLNLISALRAVILYAMKESAPATGEAPLTFLDGFDSILSAVEKHLDEGQQSVDDNEIRETFFDAVDNVLSALGRDAGPSDEMTQSFVNGFKTVLSLVRNEFENGGEIIQSSDGEIKRAVMNILGNNGEIQTDSDLERTVINVFNAIFSAFSRNIDPNNEFARALFNAADTLVSIFGKAMRSNGENQPTDEEIFNELASHFNSIISAWIKGVEIQSTDLMGEAKTQLWDAILGSLATSVLNNYLNG